MLAQQRRIEMLTNNMANVQTPGFKQDQASVRSFPNMLLERTGSMSIPTQKPLKFGVHQPIGELSTGVYLQETVPKFIQGALTQTARNTDIALVDMNVPKSATGKNQALFFTVRNEAGQVRYTRNGNFTLDAQGFLTTNEGYYVLDRSGNRIQVASDDYKVTPDGTIYENNVARQQINVVLSNDAGQMVKEGTNLYRTQNGQALPTAIGNGNIAYQLQQGFVERSNVDTGQTMTDMLTAYRAFEASQKVVQAFDKSMDRAVNEIGKLG